jgi:hypothetical protein
MPSSVRLKLPTRAGTPQLNILNVVNLKKAATYANLNHYFSEIYLI